MRRTVSVLLTQGVDADLQCLWARRPWDADIEPGYHGFPADIIEPDDHTLPGVTSAHTGAAARVALLQLGLLALQNEDLLSTRHDPLWYASRAAILRGDEVFEDRLRSRPIDASRYADLGHWDHEPWRPEEHAFCELRLTQTEAQRLGDTLELPGQEWVRLDDALERFRRGEVMLSAPVRQALERLAAGDAEAPADAPERRHEVAGGWTLLPLSSPTLPPATHTNCVIVGDDAFVVIDPGTEDKGELARLFAVLDARLARGDTFKAICLTHHHFDHVCGIAPLQARYGKVIPVWAHRETAEALGRGVRVAKRLRDGDVLTLGDVELECLWTPGHAPGHLMFLERRWGVCAGGDLVASKGTIVVRPPEGSMADYMASLRRARDLDLRILYPSHGEALVEPRRVFERYLSHRQAREDQVIEALRARNPTPVTALDLVGDVYQDVPRAVWPIAAFSLQAHLEHLVELGEATRSGVTFVSVQEPS